MLFIIISSTLGVCVLVCPAIFMDTGNWQTHCNGSFYIPCFIGRCYALNSVADVTATIVLLYMWLMESHCGNVLPHYVVYLCGRWKVMVAGVMSTCVEQLVGVIANVVDGIST